MIEYILGTLFIGGGIGAIIALGLLRRRRKKELKKAQEIVKLNQNQLNKEEVKYEKEKIRRDRGSSTSPRTTPRIGAGSSISNNTLKDREGESRIEEDASRRVRETTTEQPRRDELPDFGSL